MITNESTFSGTRFLMVGVVSVTAVANVIDNINNNNDNNNHNSQQNNVNNNNQFKYQIVMMWKIKAMLELFLMKKPMLMLLHM